MGSVLESVVGSWGSDFVAIGLVISVQGAYLAWTLVNAEVLYMPARTHVMPRFLERQNTRATPIAALVTTSLSIQLLLLVVLVIDNALDFMLKLDSALSLIPYLLAAAYALKLTITRETYGPDDERDRRRNRAIAVLAVAYSVLLLYSAGPEYLVLACIVYAPGTLLYRTARREQRERVFRGAEAIACALLTAAAFTGVGLIANGVIDV
jgi:arginine:ornithine antiporter/lysine permease